MTARLLTGADLSRYVHNRNVESDLALAEKRQAVLPAFEAHLRRIVIRGGQQVSEFAIVAGNDRREVVKLASAQPYPCKTLFDAPNDLAYLGEIGKTCWGRPIVEDRRAVA